MDLNILSYFFVVSSLLIGFLGILFNYLEHYLPVLLTRTFRYGKFSVKVPHARIAKLEIPKRWFGHFYIFAAPAGTTMLCLALYKYFCYGYIPEILFTLLDILLGSSRKPLVSAENVILAIAVYNIHCWKRLYESYYISVFSNQKMHLFHYVMGYVHYMATLLCIIGESELFIKDAYTNVSLHKLTIANLVCAFIALWSSYMQFRSNIILANLRKNKYGDVVSQEHKIPFDGLFKYISGALHCTEIIVYVMLSGILWQASTYHLVSIWVIVNQVVCAFLTHQWYHETFKNYPKERKIIIPYVW